MSADSPDPLSPVISFVISMIQYFKLRLDKVSSAVIHVNDAFPADINTNRCFPSSVTLLRFQRLNTALPLRLFSKLLI